MRANVVAASFEGLITLELGLILTKGMVFDESLPKEAKVGRLCFDGGVLK